MAQQTQAPAMSVDARLTELENQVAALKQQVDRNSSKGWLDRLIGSTKDMPDFDDVVRYGTEARHAQKVDNDVPA